LAYRPFPGFADWNVDFDPSVVGGYALRLERARAAATPRARRRALDVATRYAAVDTGALEGLYTTDRGFTKTIALQTEYWQRALDARGERVVETALLIEQSMEARGPESASAADIVTLARDLPGDDVELLSRRLLELAREALIDALGEDTLGGDGPGDEPALERLQVQVWGGNQADHPDQPERLSLPVPDGYAQVSAQSWLAIAARTGPGVGIAPVVTHVVAMARGSRGADFLIVLDDAAACLPASASDLEPIVTTAFRLRLEMWAASAVQRFRDRLYAALRDNARDG
jgi:hypothetical protein